MAGPEANQLDEPARWRSRCFTVLVIASATLLAYSNSFNASFHLDDFGIVVQNPRMFDLGHWWPPIGSRWVGEVSFAVNRHLWGEDVAAYHAVNLAIHLLTALLVTSLTALTLRTPVVRAGRLSPLVREYLPMAAGLLFAVHPLATQAVTYIVQRFTSLATLLYLLTLVLYGGARLSFERASRLTWSGLVQALLALVSAAAAVKTKEIAVTLPVMALGYDLLFFRSSRRLVLGLLLVPLAAVALIPLFDPTLGQRLAVEASLPRANYALTQTRVVARYLRLLVLPTCQNLDYDFPLSQSILEPAVLASLGTILLLVAFGVAMLIRARVSGGAAGLLIGGGISWFFVTLSVESSVIPIRDVIFEHRTYLPSVGAAIAFGTGLLLGVERLRLPWPRRVQVGAALVLAALPLGCATYLRNRVWRDDLSLWSDVVAKSPGKARPHQFLGAALAELGELDAAEREFLIALQLEPRYLEAAFNLGNTYLQKGQIPLALGAFSMAVQTNPQYAMAHNNLGAVLQRLGRLEQAAAEYKEALRIDPSLTIARKNLLRLEMRVGDDPKVP